MLVEHEEIRALMDELRPSSTRARLASLVRALEEHCAAEEARSRSTSVTTEVAAAQHEERWLLVTIAGRLLAGPHDRATRTVRLRNLRAAFAEHCTRTERR